MSFKEAIGLFLLICFLVLFVMYFICMFILTICNFKALFSYLRSKKDEEKENNSN